MTILDRIAKLIEGEDDAVLDKGLADKNTSVDDVLMRVLRRVRGTRGSGFSALWIASTMDSGRGPDSKGKLADRWVQETKGE